MSRPRVLVVSLAAAVGLLLTVLGRRDPPAPAVIALPAPEAPRPVQQADGTSRLDVVAMGTLFTVVVAAEPRLAERALAEIPEELAALESRVSSWRPGSEISRLIDEAGQEAVAVSPDTLALLTLAVEISAETEGAFDVTIGPVWDLWPFRDPDRPLPTRARLDAALDLVGSDGLELRPAAQTAYLQRAGMAVSLGGVGKGFAAGRIMDALAARGVADATVSAGGDLLLRGSGIDGPWEVGVAHPRWPGQTIERFTASDLAMATSGNSKRRLVRSGRSYGHILDPRTGLPARGAESATVLGPDPARADAYATAVFVMGLKEGLAWIDGQAGYAALVVAEDGTVHRSRSWNALTAEQVFDPASPEAALPEAAPPEAAPPEAAPPEATAAADRTTPDPAPETEQRRPRASLGATVSLRVAGSLGALWIDQGEVTNAQYARFLEDPGSRTHARCHPQEPTDKDHTPRYAREGWQPALIRASVGALAPWRHDSFRAPEHPVVGVDWWDATAFAAWAGKRLPDRAEWEQAAGGAAGHPWPWGEIWDFSRANTGGEKWGERDGYLYSAPAISFQAGASPAGALHMAGNVAEWTREGWVMGGSSNSNPSQVQSRSGELRQPGYRAFDIGFRCVSERARVSERSL